MTESAIPMTLLTAASVVLGLAGRVSSTLVLGARLVGVAAQTVVQLQKEEMSYFLRERWTNELSTTG